MNRRTFVTTAAVGMLGAGCVDSPSGDTQEPAAGNSTTGDNTTPTPEIEATTIETTAVSQRQGTVPDSETTREDETVTITGAIPVSAVCRDWKAVFEAVTLEETTLHVEVDVERETGDAVCQDVLGQVEFEATLEITALEELADIVVTLPDDER